MFYLQFTIFLLHVQIIACCVLFGNRDRLHRQCGENADFLQRVNGVIKIRRLGLIAKSYNLEFKNYPAYQILLNKDKRNSDNPVSFDFRSKIEFTFIKIAKLFP